MKEPTKIKPQIIEKNGKPEFVVIPYDEFKRLSEAAEKVDAIVIDLDDLKKPLMGDEVGRRLDRGLGHIVDSEVYIPHEVVKAQFLHNVTLMKAWREHLGLTQAKVAKAAGMSQPAYQKLERISAEVRRTRPATLKKIAEAMGITVEQLTED